MDITLNATLNTDDQVVAASIKGGGSTVSATLTSTEERIDADLENMVIVKVPTDGGSFYEIGSGLTVKENVLSVDVAQNFDGDNTRPVEAAFMQTVVGNIEILLETI